MNEKFVNELVCSLYGIVPENYLEEVKNKICMVTNRYEVTHVCTDVDTWHSQLPQCLGYFLITKKIDGLSDGSLYNYKNFISDMLRTIYKPIEEITANDTRGYLGYVKEIRKTTNSSLNNRRSVLNTFFSWIAAEGYISANPILTIRPIKAEKKERKSLTSLEMELVRSVCRTKREKALVEFFASTACRVSEAVNINVSGIDFTNGRVVVVGKGNKERTVYLNSRAIVLIRDYLKYRKGDDPALFTAIRIPYKRLHKEGIERIVNDIGERVGLCVHPHLIRHTSATLAINKGMPATSLQKLLGHSSLDTTMIYAKVSQSEVMSDHNKYIS